ncbi:SLC13 family permease [Psychromonas ossibalaenae]|uniref:SLC13 family permease n=1 Tax=Psychromonas ossibalaenae TaxID=444922 RepID=UPI000360EDA3|nr:SLC13 family permease [Psychromonas ossibalaenae]
MTSVQGLVLTILLALVVLLITTKIKPALLFVGALLICYLGGLIEVPELMKNFANESLLTLVLLMMISGALEKTRLIALISHCFSKGSYTQVILKLSISTAFLSSFMNNTAVVASLISAVKRNNQHAPSKLLIPLSYAAICGGTLTLVGTSTNLIVNSFVIEKGLPALGFFEFSLVGLAGLAAGVFVLLTFSRLLPDRQDNNSDQASYFLEAKVNVDSPLIDVSVSENNLRNLQQLYLAEIVREGEKICPVCPNEIIREKDRLMFCGDVNSVGVLQDFQGLDLFAEHQLNGQNLVEVIISPSAGITGKTLKECRFRENFDAVVVAIRRGHTPLEGGLGKVELREGDTLLLAPGKSFEKNKNLTRNFVVISGVDASTRLDITRSCGVILGFLTVVLLAVFNLVPLFKGLLILLVVSLLMGALSWTEVRRRFPLEIWAIVGAALSLAHLMTSTGLADVLGRYLQLQLNGFGVLGAFIAIYLVTLLLTELITNNAAAALAFPIAYSLALAYDVSIMPFIMAVIFGSSASFISPYGYQTNLMVYSAGDYEFKDYLKMGIPMSIIYSAVVLFTIPQLFPF